MRLTLVATVLTTACCLPARAQSNPYCVTGLDWRTNGGMSKLGMPGGLNRESGRPAYGWGSFSAYNIPAMTNPCYRWGTGTPPKHCYNVDTDTISDPAWTQSWVLANPGKVYLIGNEPDNPDLAAGDGMTPQSYARMFHTYSSFIKPLDPTARIAVAGLAAGSSTSEVNADISWWTQSLAYYKSQFGVDMPVDIWNCHCYTGVGALDPDRIISAYFVPFRAFVDTVSGGIYADKPVWCTEYGVAMWSTQLAPSYQAEFVQQLCPRLEQPYLLPTGVTKRVVDRFFWFLGPWEPPWQDSALLNAESIPTVAGQAYSALARSYPNAVPPPPADPPAPPAVLSIESSFDTDTAPWRVMGGDWVIDNGTYRQTRMTGASGLRTHLPYWYTDVHIEADVKINAVNSPTNWVGLNLRGGTIWKGTGPRAYLVLLRQNGELDLYNPADLTVVAVPNVVTDTSVFHRLGVTLDGWHFEITIDGQTRITWDDPNHRYAAGFVGLETSPANCSFDNVTVVELRPSDLDYDGDVDQSDFGHFQACLTGANIAQNDPACRRARMDDDTDVDGNDLALFQRCIRGPGTPAGATCRP